MKIHFIGIGGIGISGLAQFCYHRGDTIQGSDLAESAIFPVLRKLNIPLFLNQSADNITNDIDLVVYTEAIPENNPELVQAGEMQIACKTYFEYLGEISKDYYTVAIAGTHGKTTTTGLVAAGCLEAGFDATFLVGSTLKEFNGSNFRASLTTPHHSRVGGNPQKAMDPCFRRDEGNKIACKKNKKPCLIVEACEYRDNFRFLEPDIVVLTSLEWDHIDYFKSEELYCDSFAKLINKAKTVIYHYDELLIARVLQNFTGERIAVPRQSDNSTQFLLKIFGEFNERNALLALTLAEKLDLKMNKFKLGLGKYEGAGRRQEFLGEKNGVQFFDDYAHHPTEVSALLQGFRKKFTNSKIGLIYEPHQYSRTREFFDEFLTAFKQADFTALWPIYAARDTEEDKQFRLEQFLEIDDDLRVIRNNDEIDSFVSQFGAGDIIIFCGAGKISEIGREWMGLG